MNRNRQDIVDLMVRLSALLEPARLKAWDEDGLTIMQLRLLGHIAEHEGCSNSELAETLAVGRPSVSALLDRMERAGFLRREISPEDRRSIRIWLEDRGRAVLDETGDDIAARGHDLLGEIPDADLAVVESALRKLLEAAGPERSSVLQGVAGR